MYEDGNGNLVEVRASDFVDPEGKRWPILSQAHVLAAARGIGRLADEDESKATYKARATKIAKRKGLNLPKSWAKAKEATEARKVGGEPLSDQMIADAFQAALMDCDDPDCDGDDDRQDGDWWREYPHVRHVFSNETPMRGIFEMGWGGDLFQRSFTMDANDEAILGTDCKQVRMVVTFVDYVGMDPDMDESTVYLSIDGALPTDEMRRQIAEQITESVATPTGTLFTEVIDLASFREAKQEADGKYHISGTAIQPGINKSQTRYYSKETLATALPLFKNAKMFIDHPTTTEQKVHPERSVMKLAGRIESAWTNESGGIDYKAVIFHPQMRDMLVNMEAVDALDAIGTSIAYYGTSSDITVEGMALDNIDEITTLKSLDIVTDPGAWGDIARMESLTGNSPKPKKEYTVDEKELKALVESLAGQVKNLTEASQKANDQAAEDRKARRCAETRATVREALADVDLPKVLKQRVIDAYADSETADGLEEAIESTIELRDGLFKEWQESNGGKRTAGPRRENDSPRTPAKRIVVGMGGKTAREHEENAGDDDDDVSPERFESAMADILGGTDGARRFRNEFVA